jgi:hypothetical protein
MGNVGTSTKEGERLTSNESRTLTHSLALSHTTREGITTAIKNNDYYIRADLPTPPAPTTTIRYSAMVYKRKR